MPYDCGERGPAAEEEQEKERDDEIEPHGRSWNSMHRMKLEGSQAVATVAAPAASGGRRLRLVPGYFVEHAGLDRVHLKDTRLIGGVKTLEEGPIPQAQFLRTGVGFME